MTPPARAVFLGTGSFAVPALEALARHPAVELAAVVTAPPRRAGRGHRDSFSPVWAWATAHDMATLTPLRLRAPESIASVAELRPDVLVLADYGQIVPGALLDLPPHGALNLHPSLLPRHRGAAPVQAAIVAGDRETGVTVIRMDEGLDTGPMVAQRRVQLDGRETAPELEHSLAALAAEMLAEVLPRWLAREVREVPQPETGATLTRLLSREDGRLDPRRAVAELERQVRAYQPWPGSFLELPGGRILVHRARPAPPDGSAGDRGDGRAAADDGPGSIRRGRGGSLELVAADGALELLEVQPQGGRRMTGAELLRGRPGLVGSRVSAGALG